MPGNDIIENIKLAFEYQEQGGYREAIAVLYKVLQIEPDNIEVIIQIAYLFYAKHDLDIAVEYYEKALQIDNKNLSALEGLLILYKSTKDYKKALNISNKVCEIAPNPHSFIDHLYLLCILEEYDLAVKFYETSNYKYLANNFIHFYAGFANFHLGNFVQSEILLRKSLALDEKSSEALYYLAKILYDRRDYEGADSLLTKVLEIRQSGKTYNLKGLISMALHQNEKAISNFSFAVKINNKIPEYHYNLAIAYCLNGWLEEAERYFHKAVFLAPDNPEYHYMLGYLYYEKREFERALEELQFIKKIQPDYLHAEILTALIDIEQSDTLNAGKILEALRKQGIEEDFLFYALGKLNKKLDMHAEAILNFELALKLLPESLDYRAELVECFILIRDFKKAKVFADEALNINKKYFPAYLLKTKILMSEKMFDEAMETVDEAINLDGNSDEAYFLKAKILFEQKIYNTAIDVAKNAITLVPDNAEYYAFVAETFMVVDGYEDAYSYYKEAIAIDTGNIEYYYNAAVCAEELEYFYEASNNYMFAYRLETRNTFIISEYAKFLCRRGKDTKALKFLDLILKDEHLSASVRRSLELKYKTIEEDYLNNCNPAQKFIYRWFYKKL